jgi:hypothetical protein
MNVQRDRGRKNASRADFWEMLNAGDISNIGGSTVFCSNLAQYEWRNVDKKPFLVPFNQDAGDPESCRHTAKQPCLSELSLRWATHHVWIVDGILRRGESNVLARRRLYLEEVSWQIVYGEGFDGAEALIKCYVVSRQPNFTFRVEGEWYPIYGLS